MGKIKCEECDGKGAKSVTGFFDYSDRAGEYTTQILDCSHCYKTGYITPAQAQARRIGKFIRAGRNDLDLTLREQAKILGMTLSELNAIEQGRIYEK